MKKLIIAFAAICIAAFANAGSIRWSFYDVTDPVNGDEMFTGGTAYLFLSSVSASDVETAIMDGTFSTAFASKASVTMSFEDGQFKTSTLTDDSYTGTMTFYSVVLDNATSPENYIVSENVTQTIGTTGYKSFSYTYGDNTSTWQAVPEPTSGLLLLLGVAGLALRRKKA